MVGNATGRLREQQVCPVACQRNSTFHACSPPSRHPFVHAGLPARAARYAARPCLPRVQRATAVMYGSAAVPPPTANVYNAPGGGIALVAAQFPPSFACRQPMNARPQECRQTPARRDRAHYCFHFITPLHILIIASHFWFHYIFVSSIAFHIASWLLLHYFHIFICFDAYRLQAFIEIRFESSGSFRHCFRQPQPLH